MVVDMPENLERALKEKALLRGESTSVFVRELLDRELAPSQDEAPKRLLKSGYGILAKYGPAPSAKEIDENRREMFRTFGEDF